MSKKGKKNTGDDSMFSPSSKITANNHSDSDNDEIENGIESEVDEEIDQPVEGLEQSDDEIDGDFDGELDESPKTEPSFIDTDITLLISSSLQEMNSSEEACCSKPITDLSIKYKKPNGDLTTLKGRQVIQKVAIVGYNNKFPISMAPKLSGFQGIEDGNLKYTGSGVEAHVICEPNTAKTNLDIPILTIDSAKTTSFRKKYPGLNIDNIKEVAKKVDSQWLVKIDSPLAPVLQRVAAKLQKNSTHKTKPYKIAHNYMFMKDESYNLLIQSLMDEAKTSLPLGDISTLRAKVAPSFSSVSQTGEKRQVSDSPWLCAQDIGESQDDPVRNSKISKKHQLYITVRITHSPITHE
jgi:hypothetical protein